MEIAAVRRHQQVRGEPASYPRLILERGTGWSDFEPPDTTRYETLFDVHVDEAPGRRTLIGSIKILQRGRPSVQLPPEMSALPDDCCSLGQTIDYYAALEKLGATTCDAILRALRDVTTDDALARAFEHEPGLRISLLRFSEARRIYHYRPRRLHREPPPRERLALHFEATLPGFSDALEDRHTLDLDLHPEPGRVGRLAALVGENGVGKTSLLARLAAALWGLGRNDRERLHIDGPPVGRVIAVSYSALDVFDRPPHDFAGNKDDKARRLEARPVADNYRYCGFRDRDGSLRPQVLFDWLGEDIDEIDRLGRRAMWTSMLEETRLASADPDLSAAVADGDVEAMKRAAAHLGAGQKTALSVLTRLLASLRNGALVLLDEPELNLHPSLLAAMLRVLHAWLDDRAIDGYGIVATHSPIVLQEIPGRNVRVYGRQGRIPYVRPYEGESFGQGLSEIVDEVFGLDEQNKNYVAALRELLAAGVTPEQIEAALRQPLSLSVRMALRVHGRGGSEDA